MATEVDSPNNKAAAALRPPATIQMVEESLHLVRQAPLRAFTYYYAGAIPFIVGMLYFWTEMSHGMFAEERLLRSAVMLSGLFIWMKCLQSIYCAELFALVSGTVRQPLGRRAVARLVVQQAIVQPMGVLLLPLSILALVPFGWMYGYYQSVTVLGAHLNAPLAEVRAAAWKQTRLWASNLHSVIWLLSPWLVTIILGVVLVFFGTLFAHRFGEGGAMAFQFLGFTLLLMLAVFSPVGTMLLISLAAAALTVPTLLKALTGIDTPFTVNADLLFNSTFLTLLCCAVYLILDPFLKAAFVLRCFYGRSRSTGEDLLAELPRLATRRRGVLAQWLLVGLLLAGAAQPLSARAGEGDAGASETGQSAAPSEFDRAINQVFERSEFRWRMPREMSDLDLGADMQEKRNWLEKQTDWFQAKLDALWEKTQGFRKAIVDYFEGMSKSNTPAPSSRGMNFNVSGVMKTLIVILILSLASVGAFVAWRMLRGRAGAIRAQVTPVLPEEPAPATPDLNDEHVAADALPEDSWKGIANDLIAKGEYRLAMRALFLANLAFLGERQWIRVARAKTNRDYLRELDRRAHAMPQVRAAFTQTIRQFEGAWYGMHEVTRDSLDDFITDAERIRDGA